eukprot:TRINITY_DN1906_c1_g3_i1.p1 TRINITY_DN1906_c1_g3~~TRINITY_DN1906_c1_g3_i1.p1  ORF type:complete len:415 (-),score=43.09 TRINITY_DN1906_c1_g3_i1:97-1341(-)
MSRVFVSAASLGLALVFSLRRDRQGDEDSLLIGPPLCDAEIVADMCKKLNEETIEYYGPTSNMDMSVVHAAELSEYTAASLKSIRFFLGKINATNKQTNELLLAHHAFSVSCQELCEKTVASIPASRRPTYSDVGCYPAEGDSSSPDCTIDLSPVALESMPMTEKNPDVDGGVKAETKVSEDLQQEMEELLNAEKPDKSFVNLQTAFALMFRVYPVAAVTQPDEDDWPEGVEVPKRAAEAEASSASFIETGLSRSDVQVAVRLTGRARSMISTALRNLNANRVKKWFTSGDSRTVSTVRSALNSAANVLSNVEYKNGLTCMQNVVAYVRPVPPAARKFGLFGPYIVALCPPFYITSETFRVHTLVHEAFHHKWSYTWDFSYGRAGVLALPAWKQKWNADSYAYLVCDAAGVSCP